MCHQEEENLPAGRFFLIQSVAAARDREWVGKHSVPDLTVLPQRPPIRIGSGLIDSQAKLWMRVAEA
jgi:hypothetical protein